MAELWQVLLLTTLAGATIPTGGYLAHRFHIKNRHLRADVLATIIAFGGGALLAAVALVLIPEGLRVASPWITMPAFIGGSVAFLGVHFFLDRRGTKGDQFAAMMLDYVPESIALGAALASGSPAGLLLAALIAFQNLPEGFNAYRDFCKSSFRRRTSVILLLAAVPLGPLAGYAGFTWFVHQDALLGGVLMFAAGGIVSIIFQEIAPHAHRKHHIAPTFGVTAGFCVGLIGHVLLVA